MNNIIEVNNLTKNYHNLHEEIEAIKDITFSLKEGEYIRLRLMTPKEMLRFMGVEDADIDLTVCEDCPHKDCGCRDGEDCVMEGE